MDDGVIGGGQTQRTTAHLSNALDDRYAELEQKRSRQEMHHAEELIARIIFLEGTPTVSRLHQIHIGEDFPKQVQADHEAELHTVGLYNEAIHLSDEASDAATRELLESIVKEEDAHVDWLEEQLDQIAQLGVPRYLSTQTRA